MSEMYNDLSVTEHFFFNRNSTTEEGNYLLHASIYKLTYTSESITIFRAYSFLSQIFKI
jgi:hypothetical protein